jgi:hypothetical protein
MYGIKKKSNEDGGFHFLGNIVLCKDYQENNIDSYFIIDGQQRITSLTIIISIIRYLARKDNQLKNKNSDELEKSCKELIEIKSSGKTIYKLRIPDLNKMKYGSEFQNFIQKMQIDELTQLNSENVRNEDCDYLFRLQDISNALLNNLEKMTTKNFINLVNFIGSKCIFMLMETDTFSTGHSIFCSLNTPGEPISAVEYFRARYYGQLAKEKGLKQAERLIENKISILNEIYATEGVKEMNKFLAHVCRLKMVEKNCEEEFLNSFNITDSDLLKYLSNYTDTLGNCDLMLEEIKSIYSCWKKIFHQSINCESKLALMTLRDGHLNVWISFALLTALNDYELKNNFWKKVDKFMIVNMVNNNDENDFLSKSYEILTEIKPRQPRFNKFFDIDEESIKIFCNDIKYGLRNLSGNCIKYLLLRPNIRKKKFDLTMLKEFQLPAFTDANSSFEDMENILGTYILIDSNKQNKIRNKTWEEMKKILDVSGELSYSYEVFKEPCWNIETLRKTQNKYMKFFGKLYNIEELKTFEIEFHEENQTRNRSSNNIITNLNEEMVTKIAKEISGYLNNVKTDATEKGIKESIRHIINVEYMDYDSILRILLKMQKCHKIYRWKRQETLKKWIQSVKSNKGHKYLDIFLLYTDYKTNK